MIPVDLNRLREARDVLIEPKRREMEQALYERTKAVDVLLDAPTVWWCEQGHGICVDVTEKLIERGDETAIAYHSRCGLRALVPVKYADDVMDGGEELGRSGWVKRPVCEPCMGTGGVRVPCPGCKNEDRDHSHDCPSCGGTGFGRLVALDGIDVGIIEGYAVGRLGYSDFEHGVHVADALADLARQVLAAIDGGQE